LDFKGIQNQRQGDSDMVAVCACSTSGRGAVGLKEWEWDARCPRRRKENCANDGEWTLAMRDDVRMGMRPMRG
jgi:hypothetical protein